MATEQFEYLEEGPPLTLLQRLLMTLRHVIGLLGGAGIDYIRHKRDQGRGGDPFVLLFRLLLIPIRPFLDKEIISQPFPVQFRLRLEMMGPTYIKLGQILSLRDDILPRSVTSELQNHLLNQLPVVRFERYLQLIEESLNTSASSVFAWMERKPLGSASIAQLHRAGLHTGEEVVVKVVKPGVREALHQDCLLLRLLANVAQIPFARFQPKELVYEFCDYTTRETDLRIEADNAETFAANFQDQPDVRFPKIYRAYSSRDVLCMEYMKGQSPTADVVAELSNATKKRVIDLGIGAAVRMIFRDGFFHADMHPGNLLLLRGDKIALIDLGMVGRINEETRRGMLYYFYSLVSGDVALAARFLVGLAVTTKRSKVDEFRSSLEELNRRWVRTANFSEFSVAQLVLASVLSAGRYKVFYPKEIVLMVKALATVEGVGYIVNPNLDLASMSSKHMTRILLAEFNPSRHLQGSLISIPMLLDVVMRAPMVLSEGMGEIEKRLLTQPSDPMRGVRSALLAGFCLIAGVIVYSTQGHWILWASLIVAALILTINASK